MVPLRKRSKKKYRLLIYNGSFKEQVPKKKGIQVWYSKSKVNQQKAPLIRAS